jgi:hypothetical protein
MRSAAWFGKLAAGNCPLVAGKGSQTSLAMTGQSAGKYDKENLGFRNGIADQRPVLAFENRRLLLAVDIVAVVVLALWLAIDHLSKPLFGQAGWPASAVDYAIIYDASRFVVANHSYPQFFPYPPAAVVLLAVATLFPAKVSFAIWLVVVGGAAAVSYWSIARILGLRFGSGLMPVLVLAQVASAYAIQWDMRSLNTNLVVLAAVLLGVVSLVRGREIAAGCWVALAVALKIIPVLLIVYFAWTKRYKAFVSAIVATFVFWVVAPFAVFGSGIVDVYRSWLGEIMRAASPDIVGHAILISLWKAAEFIGRTDAKSATATVVAVLACWIVLGVLAAIGAMKAGPDRSRQAVLADVGILVLGPAALSTYLEPYHVVGMVIPAAVVACNMLDRSVDVGRRSGATFALLVAIFSLPFSSFEMRGLAVNGATLVLCWAAFMLARTSAPHEVDGMESASRSV